MLPSADKLYGDADFIFQQDFAPAHTAKVPKAGSMTYGVLNSGKNDLVMLTDCCSSCPGWLVSDDLGGEDAGCGGPWLMSVQVVCGCEAGGCTAKFSETPLEMAYGK